MVPTSLMSKPCLGASMMGAGAGHKATQPTFLTRKNPTQGPAYAPTVSLAIPHPNLSPPAEVLLDTLQRGDDRASP